MAYDTDSLTNTKISPAFASRLERLGPDETIRAIVMLETDPTHETTRRPTIRKRRANIKRNRELIATLLPQIDRILKQHDGKRIESRIDLLGAVPVIVTSNAINALTDLEYVKAIVEDQPLMKIA